MPSVMPNITAVAGRGVMAKAPMADAIHTAMGVVTGTETSAFNHGSRPHVVVLSV